MTGMSSGRFAIYFTPDASTALWRLGSALLGYDAAAGRRIEQMVPAGIAADDWALWTREPAGYGFHATLKAPFELAAGATVATLSTAIAALAGRLATTGEIPLALHGMGAWQVLRPAVPVPSLDAIAAECVLEIDRFRAPPSTADMARRLRSPLSTRQRDYLDRYGYPNVLQDFRFHMTLAGPIPVERRIEVNAALGRHLAKYLSKPSIVVDALSLVHQPTRDHAFRIAERLPFGPAPVRRS